MPLHNALMSRASRRLCRFSASRWRQGEIWNRETGLLQSMIVPYGAGSRQVQIAGSLIEAGCSIRFRGNIASKRSDRVIELPVSSKPSVSPVEFDGSIRLNGCSFKNCAFPCVI